MWYIELAPVDYRCINRNIVECKSICLLSSAISLPVLIETLWNVNICTFPLIYTDFGINRNIMECK